MKTWDNRRIRVNTIAWVENLPRFAVSFTRGGVLHGFRACEAVTSRIRRQLVEIATV
jgi:hypothetical protein